MARTTQRPYIKVDQSLGDHRRSLDLSPKHYLAALGLHVLGIGYCDRMRSDGYIPDAIVPRIGGTSCKAALAELVRVGFWETTDGGYQIHDYLDWQDSASELDAKREQAQMAANKSWDARRNANGKAKRNAKRIASGSASGNAPEPNHTEPEDSLTGVSLSSPNLTREDDSEIVPSGIAEFAALYAVWERVTGSIASEATKRTIRAWCEMGYSPHAVEAALKTAAENGAKSPAKYASAILRTNPREEAIDGVPIADLVAYDG